MTRLSSRVARRFLQSGRSDVLNAWDAAFGVEAYPPDLRGPEGGPWTGTDDRGREIVLRELPDGTLKATLDGKAVGSLEKLVDAVVSGREVDPGHELDPLADLRVDVHWMEPGDLTAIAVDAVTPAGQQQLLDVQHVLIRHDVSWPDADPAKGGISGGSSRAPDETSLQLVVRIWFAQDDGTILSFGDVPQSLVDAVRRFTDDLSATGATVGDSEGEIFQPETAELAMNWDPGSQTYQPSYVTPFPPFRIV